ncbi:2OG-Fe(II) oxygenase-related protein [Arenicella chitinivorans]|uniref:2OG-Fe(II) oxygenase-related protein n=1 Tax=Arenicella chitinivorans TaxID=1329800 RepID=A0A918S3A9_9GAMM|nr:TIGR02466 family protein [Arenicella chitinivorans]GHA20736.1 2OG-Fe(II) oxygenase-related protein [Arenicella chitinivorans]
MTLTKELFFPTPIYFIDVEDAEALNAFLKTRIYSWREQDATGVQRSNVRQVGAWHSTTTMSSRPEFASFVDLVSAQVQQVFGDQLYAADSHPFCLNMWANINPRQGYNRSHVHPGSLWSGVYYVQAPENCGQLIFQDPRAQVSVMAPSLNESRERGAEHWPEVYHRAVEGRLILFPSWLRHEVEPNMSPLTSPDSDRVSISFNYGQQLVRSKGG